MHQQNHFQLPESKTFSGTIGNMEVSFREIKNPMTNDTRYLIILQGDTKPLSFSMHKTGSFWQIRDREASLLFGHLERDLDLIISKQ